MLVGFRAPGVRDLKDLKPSYENLGKEARKFGGCRKTLRLL